MKTFHGLAKNTETGEITSLTLKAKNRTEAKIIAKKYGREFTDEIFTGEARTFNDMQY